MKIYNSYDFCIFLDDCFIRHRVIHKDFCSATGIDPAHLSRILSGKSNPTLKTIFTIIRYFEGHVSFSVDDDKIIKIDL